MITTKLIFSAAMLAGLATACGGSNNGKLNRRVNQGHLAPVSAAERAGEAEAQREFFLAEWQVAFTESQLRGAKLDIDIAKNELASAKLALKNSKLENAAAAESNDQNAIAEKQQAERIATLQIEVHKLAIERAKQSKRYLEKRLVHEQRSVRSREAGVELARANSLNAAGIKPPDFDAKKYKTQQTERAASEKAARAAVDAEKAKLAATEKQLLGAKNAVAAAEGNPVLKQEPIPSKPMEPLEGDTPPEQPPATGEDPGEETPTAETEETPAAETEDVPTKTSPPASGGEPVNDTATKPGAPSEES